MWFKLYRTETRRARRAKKKKEEEDITEDGDRMGGKAQTVVVLIPS